MKSEKEISDKIIKLDNEIDNFRSCDLTRSDFQEEIRSRREQIKTMKKKIIIITILILILFMISVTYQYYHYKMGTDCGCAIKYFSNQLLNKPTMYGSYLCSQCQHQKTVIEQSKYNYVECTTNKGQSKECIDNHIIAYPTWIFTNGIRHEGEINNSEFNEFIK